MQETLLNSGTKLRRRLAHGFWAPTLILLAALAFLVWRARQTGFDPHDFLRAFGQVHWGWLAAAWAVGMLSYAGRTIRWMVMLRPLAPAARHRDVLSATLIGFTAIYLFGRAGELVRPWLIARSTGASLPSQFAALLLERVYDTLLILAFFGYALASTIQLHPTAGPQLRWLAARGGWIIGITGSLCLAALVLLQHWAPRFEHRIIDALGFLRAHHHEKAAALVRSALEGLRVTASVSSVARLLFWSIVEWGVIYASFRVMFNAFPETAGLAASQVVAYIGFVAIGSVIQIPGIGGGFQVASVLVTTELFHVPLETAASLALLNWLLAAASAVPFGVLLALRAGLRWRQLSHLESEAVA
ncbi:MAG: lysylphosphatidylglycerol synthase transmembrane domain-containing protein [Bryobacteraceae bacterium]